MSTSETITATEQSRLFVTMAISAWNTQNNRVTKLISTFDQSQWMNETAPGRNRGIYLLGHLIAVSDGLFPLFGIGPRLYPELEKIFLTSPDRTVADLPSLEQLNSYWQIVNQKLDEAIKNYTLNEWLSRHTAISAEDFAKEPHRNKLNVLLNRTSHTAYHLGQLAYLSKKELH